MNKNHRRKLLVVGLLLGLGLVVFVSRINDFLAITRPIHGNVLVIEAWMWNSDAMQEAATVASQTNYEWVVTVGDPIGGTNLQSTAEAAAARLQALGVDVNRLVLLPVPTMPRHQSYTSATTVRRWLETTPGPTTGVDVFTLGTHARKSLVLFKRALGPDVSVGVIAGTEDTFDPSRWWLSARGIYVIVRKTLGYLYAVTWPFPDAGEA